MSAERVAVTLRIAASAEVIYAIVSDPAGHVRIDGSGMLAAAPDARPVTAVGDTFDMAMDRAPLNDIPGLGKYTVRNTVTQLVPGRLVEWTIGAVDQPPLGHVYGWQLDPVDDHTTDVTNYCDWSNIVEALRAAGRTWPIVPVAMLEQSVANLERVATGG
ncbi:MAG TPA: polyketide cyclase [Acidimicrobiaceae bacterium]|nr:polyketide cyclase [Acidimicrobiaceae bacterium]